MQKIIRLTSIVILLCLISYSLLVFLNQNTAKAVSQSISSNIDEIDETLYPGIKERIKKLQEKYPNWKFELLYTDLEWNEVINAEYSGHGISPKNLVEYTSGYKGQWICSICKEEHKYDNGNWRCASIEAIQYKMDPRNILNETDIFQLEELSNKGYTIEDLQLITNNTYLSGQEQSIINVANNCNINSFYLAARLIQEQGTNPTSPLALGTGYNGQYVGYYNVFNIKASGSTSQEVILNGLSHAKQKGWDSLEKSIQAGINFLATNYISKGQNTLYLQKFDVEIKNGLYSNQYMQNITAPTTEAATLRKAYSNTNSIDSTHTFLIPLYKNMPNEVCTKPDVNGKSKYKDYSIFRVNADPTLFLRDKPAGNIIQSQTLNGGELVTLLEKATMKVNGTYWDKVQRYNGAIGYAARETSENELPNYKLYLVPVFIEEIPEEDNNKNEDNTTEDSNNNNNNNENNTPEDNNNNNNNNENNTPEDNNNNNNNENNTPEDNDNNNSEDNNTEPIIVETKNGKYKIENDTIIVEPNVILDNVKEKYLDATSDSQSLGTGKKITINAKSYTIIKLGDVSGDGEIKSKDYMMIKNYIMKTLELNDIEKIAADVSNDKEIKSKDYMMIKNHIMKISSITL